MSGSVPPPGAAAALARGVLSLGSNVGDREAFLQRAVDALAVEVPLLAVSPVYETAPVGGVDQDDYLNAVVLVDCADPTTLLALAHRVENDAGRVRGQRWGPRTLDIDLVAVAGRVSDDPECTLPHPRAHERAFVLAPWADVDAAAVLPGRGRVSDLLAAVGTELVRRRGDLVLSPSRRGAEPQ